MKRNTDIIAMALCIVLILSLAACGSSAANTADSTAANTAEEQTVTETNTAEEQTATETNTAEETKTEDSTAAEETKSEENTASESTAAEDTSKTEDTTSSDTASEAENSQYGAVKLSDGETLTEGTYTATGDDESVLEASGSVSASASGITIKKTDGSASSADGASFYGVNAAVRVYENAELSLTDCTIEASASNATGVFAYQNGVINIENSTVTVSGGGAGGIQVAGGGTLYAKDLTVTSASKAAIRSDRGGGTMVVDGGTYTSTGSNGCPAIYSTADITVKNAVCVSEKSRAVIIEGKNSVTLENCTLSGNDQSTKSGSVRANVLLYQSASGDASVGTSEFTMKGGRITSLSGAMFYCTNTSSVIDLSGAELVLSDDGSLLIVSAGRWGKDGSNGGHCTFKASSQVLEGTIYVDSISSLSLDLTDGSSFTGSISSEGTVSVSLDSSSTWTLTGDSYISSLSGDTSGIDLNGYTLYVNGTAFTI